jgi:hypothetical protein
MAQSALIKITIDPGKGIATINGLKVALTDLTNAQKKFNDETKKQEKVIEGTLKWHQMMIAKLKAEQAAVSDSSDAYDEFNSALQMHNLAISEITKNRENELGVIRGSFQDYENQIAMLRRQQKQFANTNAAVLRFEKEIQQLRAAQRALASDTKLTGRGMQSMSSSAGLAGAAATEFGRTIGDLPYGIQGVANNIQQLTALFTDLVQSEGGLNKALKSLTSTLMGPAGILVAVSLVTAAWDFFSRRQREAKEATADFNLDLQSQILNLQMVIDAFESQDPALQAKRLQLLNAFASLNEEVGQAYEKQLISQAEVLDLLRAQSVVANAKSKLDEDDIKTLEKITTAREEQSDLQSDLLSKEKILGKIGENSVNREIRRKEINADIARIQGELAEKAEEINGLVAGRTPDLLIIADAQAFIRDREEEIGELLESNESIVANSIKDYEKRIEVVKEEMANVDLQSEKYGELDKQLAALLATYNQLLLTQRLLDIEAAEAAMEAADIRIEAAMDSVTSEQQMFAKRKELNMRERGQGDEFLSWAINFYKSLSENEAFSEEERLKFKEMYLNYRNQLEDREAKKAKETSEKVKAAFNERMDALKDISKTIGVLNDFLESEAQREIDIETNKTNAINEQLRERIRNEELTREQRDLINQEIARNDAELVTKQNKINEKRFKQQKAFNIAMAVIDTYVAANQALKDVTLVSTFAKVAAMVSIIATGLANVATISRQQFVARASRAPALRGSAGGESSAPVFNVVGSSGQNQLAQAIEGITADPIKAYIVSSEVTSAQELDRKIIQSASI